MSMKVRTPSSCVLGGSSHLLSRLSRYLSKYKQDSMGKSPKKKPTIRRKHRVASEVQGPLVGQAGSPGGGHPGILFWMIFWGYMSYKSIKTVSTCNQLQSPKHYVSSLINGYQLISFRCPTKPFIC